MFSDTMLIIGFILYFAATKHVTSQHYYEKVNSPTLLSGIQIISTAEISSRLLCAATCSATTDCVGIVVSSSCQLLEDQSIGSTPFVYSDGITVYLQKNGVGGDPYPFYSDSTYSQLSDVEAAVDLSHPLGATYKSQILENWSAFNIEKAEVAFVTPSSVINKVVFNAAAATNKYDWFHIENVLSSPWSDLTSTSPSVDFNIPGPELELRRFYMNRVHNGCPDDFGWFMVVMVPGDSCGWTSGNDPYPAILYSTLTTSLHWEAQRPSFGLAPDMLLFLRIRT